MILEPCPDCKKLNTHDVRCPRLNRGTGRPHEDPACKCAACQQYDRKLRWPYGE